MSRPFVPLSVPHLGDEEARFVAEALASNWIGPLGPQVDAFEREMAALLATPHAVALSSGTAALHLALRLAGVGPGDEVLVPTLTFAATAFPVRYLGATPVFVDSDASWNVDPSLVAEALEERTRRGRRPAAVVVVHLYGGSADLDPLLETCRRHRVPLVEDAAEGLGATYRERAPGTFGRVGIFSFNGNKMITTSTGGLLVTEDEELAAHARHLATQAREPGSDYLHREIGHNYRMSGLLAAVGRGQLRVLEERVAARRAVFAAYREALGELPGVAFMPESPRGRHSRWLSTLTIDPEAFGADRHEVARRLGEAGIESRPLWLPLHRQPVFAGCETVGGTVAERLHARGICLPSSSSLGREEIDRVVAAVCRACPAAAPAGTGG